MTRTTFRRLAFAAALAGAGCGGNGLQPVDLAGLNDDLAVPGGGGSDGGAPGDMAIPAGCSAGNYLKSTVAQMRQGKSGCFELDGIVTVAVTPVSTNGKSVTLYAGDAGGGDYSGIKISCSSTSTAHPCTAFTTAKNVLAGRTVTVQGLFIKSSPAKGGYEDFLLDSITDTGAGTAPTPATVAEADVYRSATATTTGKPVAANWFQIANINVTDKLMMFDWSPPELKRANATSCPLWLGFGMIPQSVGATPGAGCSGSTQPAGQTTVNPKEVLVGTDFYGGFKDSTDCQCATMYSTPIPTAGQGVSGTVTALLSYDVPVGSSTGYQILQPLSSTSFNIH